MRGGFNDREAMECERRRFIKARLRRRERMRAEPSDAIKAGFERDFKGTDWFATPRRREETEWQ